MSEVPHQYSLLETLHSLISLVKNNNQNTQVIKYSKNLPSNSRIESNWELETTGSVCQSILSPLTSVVLFA